MKNTNQLLKSTKLVKAMNNFIETNDRLAKKYHCEISIGSGDGKFVVLADGREEADEKQA